MVSSKVQFFAEVQWSLAKGRGRNRWVLVWTLIWTLWGKHSVSIGRPLPDGQNLPLNAAGNSGDGEDSYVGHPPACSGFPADGLYTSSASTTKCGKKRPTLQRPVHPANHAANPILRPGPANICAKLADIQMNCQRVYLHASSHMRCERPTGFHVLTAR